MGFLDFLFGRKQESASVAKERLQIVVSQERAGRNAPDFLPLLQQEVLAVVSKFLEVDDDMIEIRHMQRAAGTSILDINIELDKARIKPLPPGGGKPTTGRPASARPKSTKTAMPRGA